MRNLELNENDIVKFVYVNQKGERKDRLVEVKSVDGRFVGGWDYSVKPAGGHRNFDLDKAEGLRVLAKHDDELQDPRREQVLAWLYTGKPHSPEKVAEIYRKGGYNVRWEPEINCLVFSPTKTTLSIEKTADGAFGNINLITFSRGNRSITLRKSSEGVDVLADEVSLSDGGDFLDTLVGGLLALREQTG